MAGSTLYCAGTIDPVALTCSSGWEVVVASLPFDPSQLDPEQVVAAIGSGMAVACTVFGAVFGARAILNFLRRS